MDICREKLLHAYGRTAAAYIACDGDKILHRYHFGLFISGNSGSFFQIDFIINGNNTYKITGLITVQHEGLEYCSMVESEDIGGMGA